MKENNNITIRGAKVHNLKNVSVEIPREKYIVVTGLSGSGKSSLAFDTIYAEGQRRYVESLSAYARQFLGRIDKPEVDYITGIPPAIAIEQKVSSRNPRSTVGTSTEIYDYLKLLYARIGRTYSPVSGKEVKKHTVTDVVNTIKGFNEGDKILLLAPLPGHCKERPAEVLDCISQQGFNRVEVDGKVLKIADIKGNEKLVKDAGTAYLVIDRISVKKEDEDALGRLADSVQTALDEGDGICLARNISNGGLVDFSTRFEADGIVFEEPTEHTFSFNNPLGACPSCEGYGKIIGIDEDLVIPDKGLSIYEEAVVCWRGDKMKKWKERLIYNADKFDFPIHKPFHELTEDQKDLLWSGNRYFKGLDSFFAHLESKKYKIQYRVMLSRYRGKTTCKTCGGRRLKKEAGYVKIGGFSIDQLVDLPLKRLKEVVEGFKLTKNEQDIANRLLKEVQSRIDFLLNVGLGYLTLNRLSSTLSGGESQRINLATSLGSSLVGSLYILDEPSIGLHSRDTGRLIKVLRDLNKLGNTLIVVEHDEDIIRSADMVIDIGPRAGVNGGEIIFHGSHEELIHAENSITKNYLTGEMSIAVPARRRKWNNFMQLTGARQNNLKNIDVKFPLNIITVITGVSGSGKSTLVNDILFPALNRKLGNGGKKPGEFNTLTGDFNLIQQVEYVDQNPIGKSSRSNPVTYLKAYDEIRKLFAAQQASKINGFTPSHFSFNIEGGRCEECQGDGIIKVEMQFMADVNLLCESCHGKKFKDEVLEVTYRGKSIYDILELTVDEAIDFFGEPGKGPAQKVVEKIQPLQDVGLGYITLGQSSTTLSGGESQRVKLASFLSKESEKKNILFIFDEPTTGLHFHDINKLLVAFNSLVENGNTIIVIEHNMEIIKSADWVIDLGPEGGDEGGQLVFEGTPEKLAEHETSYTGKYLQEKLRVEPVK